MAVDRSKFNEMTSRVIDELEGGYYHPDMLKDGRVKDSRYSNSGETMFGIDRKAGGSINTTTAGKKFWGIIDNAGASRNWKWNYKGGSLGASLKQGAADIMYPEYERNATNYLSAKAKSIVDSDNRLLFHFIYASWNGAGWFKKFAADINKAVESGITNTNKLVKVAIDSRTKEGLREGSNPNSLIAQGGFKIAGFIDSLKESAKKNIPALIVVAVILTGITIYAITHQGQAVKAINKLG